MLVTKSCTNKPASGCFVSTLRKVMSAKTQQLQSAPAGPPEGTQKVNGPAHQNQSIMQQQPLKATSRCNKRCFSSTWLTAPSAYPTVDVEHNRHLALPANPNSCSVLNFQMLGREGEDEVDVLPRASQSRSRCPCFNDWCKQTEPPRHMVSAENITHTEGMDSGCPYLLIAGPRGAGQRGKRGGG